jgi:O-antigen/teichoic acid export membrane protein
MSDTATAVQSGNPSSSPVARNVLVTLATQIGSWVLTFIVTLYLPRYIGAAGLGKLAFATSFVAMFGVLVPLGTGTVLVKEIARDRRRTGELLLAAGALRILLGFAVTGLVTAIAWMLGFAGITRILVALTAIGMVVSTLNDTLASALQGQERLPRQSLSLIVEKCLWSALTLALIFHRAPLWTLAAVGGFTGLFSIAMNLSALRGYCPLLRWPSPATLRYVAVAGMPYMGWTIFRTLYGQCDPVVLALVTNDATVGWYAAASRLMGSTFFLPAALTTALFPTMARLFRANANEFRHLARRMYALNMLCGVPIALILLLLPDRLLALMHYPGEFSHSVCVLRVGGIGVLLNFAGHILGATIAACDQQRKMVRVSFLACLLGIPACVIGSYATHRLWGNGALGAMLSDVALELYLVWSYLRIMPSKIFDRSSALFMGRCVVASLPMALWLGLTPVRDLGLWAAVPCLPIYMACCWVMRCLDPEYFVLARSFLRRRCANRPARTPSPEEALV